MKRCWAVRLIAILSYCMCSAALAVDKPGLFRLDQSTDSTVCVPLGKMINADIRKYGKTAFEKHAEFVEWRPLDEQRIDRGVKEPPSNEPVEVADADLNNDGELDEVARTRWMFRAVDVDALTRLPKDKKRKIAVVDLLKSDNTIMFNIGNFWLDRLERKYGPGNYDWAFDGVASLDLLLRKGVTYIVAQHYAAPKNVSAQIYVFRLDPKNDVTDTCMFWKVCPCGGCVNVGTDEIVKTSPGKQWCGK